MKKYSYKYILNNVKEMFRHFYIGGQVKLIFTRALFFTQRSNVFTSFCFFPYNYSEKIIFSCLNSVQNLYPACEIQVVRRRQL